MRCYSDRATSGHLVAIRHSIAQQCQHWRYSKRNPVLRELERTIALWHEYALADKWPYIHAFYPHRRHIAAMGKTLKRVRDGLIVFAYSLN